MHFDLHFENHFFLCLCNRVQFLYFNRKVKWLLDCLYFLLLWQNLWQEKLKAKCLFLSSGFEDLAHYGGKSQKQKRDEGWHLHHFFLFIQDANPWNGFRVDFSLQLNFPHTAKDFFSLVIVSPGNLEIIINHYNL